MVVLAVLATPAAARDIVDASAPQDLAVTIYRDPDRGQCEDMNRNWPRGFAMISETRTITLPPGESTIRFTGVAEGMVAVSAIVTGLPGGTIEKNRNADLLSPAALVDGTLGNRVRITRTNPATGEAVTESAIVRTRADGGLVLQTEAGYEAVRCSGLPERITFPAVPDGLSPQPVFTVDTRDPAGGTYTVQLTYLAWGFDWQAHYVAKLEKKRRGHDAEMQLVSWLTLLNDNGQSFENAELMAVAGTLNVESDYEELSDPPEARPLRLTCYPLGSTAAGSPVAPPMLPPPPAPGLARDESIMVTAQYRAAAEMAAPMEKMMAEEEQLGDLKLFRVPERVTVSAKGLKQIAFLDKDSVEGDIAYIAACSPWNETEFAEAGILFRTENDERHGLGAALPMGGVTIFEPTSAGELLLAETNMRDHAEGQDVEIELGGSPQVRFSCARAADFDWNDDRRRWLPMRVTVTNANDRPARMRLSLGASGEWNVRKARGAYVKDGQRMAEFDVPANDSREFRWEIRSAYAPSDS
jgi:hypothetical protein